MVYMNNRQSINHRLLNAARLAIDSATHNNHNSDFESRRTAKSAIAELNAALEMLHANCVDIETGRNKETNNYQHIPRQR